jgi:uncharacterized protein YkwD
MSHSCRDASTLGSPLAHARRAERARLESHLARLEQLESRTLLSGFSWSAQEVMLLELVNRARANPLAEGTRLNIDLTAGLTLAEQARLVAQEPLAFSRELTLAARAHSEDMATRQFFDHVNPDGANPTARAQAQGY